MTDQDDLDYKFYLSAMKPTKELGNNFYDLFQYLYSDDEKIRERALKGINYYKDRIFDIAANIRIYIDEEIESRIEDMARKENR